MLTRIDPKGRLYIPKAMRKNLPNEVYLVKLNEGILIVPKPENPLKELEELGKRNFPINPSGKLGRRY